MFALSISRFTARHPKLVLGWLAVATVGLGLEMRHLDLQTDGAALHPRGHPVVEQTARDRTTFRSREHVIALLTPQPNGPRMTSVAGLRKIAATHAAVADVPGVVGDGVRSAANVVDLATSRFGALSTFLNAEPEPPVIEAWGRRLMARPLVRGLLLDHDAAVILVPIELGRHRVEQVKRLDAWVAEASDEQFEIRLTGPIVAETMLGDRILRDLGRLIPILAVVVTILLSACLRTLGGVIVVLTKLATVLIWTGGLMAVTGVPITLITTILPVLLLALVTTDDLHIWSRFQENRQHTPDTVKAILDTLAELHRPVVFTSVSTALGLASFTGASIDPLRQFGLVSAFGIVVAMALTFVLTPALVALLPTTWLVPRRLRRIVPWPQIPVTRPARRVAFGVGIVTLLATAPGLGMLSVQDSWIENFDPRSPLVRAERELNAKFWGTYRIEVILTAKPGTFHRPDGVALLDTVSAEIATTDPVSGVVGPVAALDTVASHLGLAGHAAELPPDALSAVLRVAHLYRADLELPQHLTSGGNAVRLIATVNSPNYERSLTVLETIDRQLHHLLEGTGVIHHLSGDLPLAVATVRAIVSDQLRSTATTLLGVALLLSVLNRALRPTIAQLVPPVVASWWILAAMGFTGQPLGVATSLFTALMLGVGVDLALHVHTALLHASARGLSPDDAIREAFESTRTGRRWSTLVLSLGFLVLTLSAFGPNHRLGLLLAAAMVASHLATRLFVPWVLVR